MGNEPTASDGVRDALDLVMVTIAAQHGWNRDANHVAHELASEMVDRYGPAAVELVAAAGVTLLADFIRLLPLETFRLLRADYAAVGPSPPVLTFTQEQEWIDRVMVRHVNEWRTTLDEND